MKNALRMAGIAIAAVAIAGTAGAQDEEPEGWKGDIGLSFAAQTGTTDTISGTLDMKGARAWEKDEVDLRFLGTIGTTRERGSGLDNVTQNSQGLFGNWKHAFTDRLFVATGTELSRDNVQRREVRFLVNTGPGYRVWIGDDAAEQHFDVSAGVGYRFEKYDADNSVATADVSEDNFADLVAAFEYKNLLFDGKLKYSHTFSARMPANRPEAYILRTELLGAVPLSDAWDLRLGFVAEYVPETPDEVNDTTTLTTIGVGYTF